MQAMDETLAARLLADAAASLAEHKYALTDAVDKVPDEPGLYALYGAGALSRDSHPPPRRAHQGPASSTGT